MSKYDVYTKRILFFDEGSKTPKQYVLLVVW